MGLRVLTVGSFTTIPPHKDHIDLFRFCSRLAGRDGQVIIGVNADHLIYKSKGFRPEQHDFNRASWLEAVHADESFVNNDLTVTNSVLRRWQPDVYVVGWDWKDKDIVAQTGLTAERLNEWRCVLAFAPTLGRVHSSDLRDK